MADTNNAWDAGSVYGRLGVAPIINAAGSITRLGGSRTRPETLELMSQAARVMVNIDDMNRAAGKELARLTGAEAGFVCSGAAGGLVLQAAAVIAGNDPVKMRQLPNTDGLKNEIAIHTMHRFPYDQAYRAAGARLVEFGDFLFTHPWQLEGAINERTAAVAYLFAPFSSNRVLPLESVCEIAHARDVPVIVDAASMLPPAAPTCTATSAPAPTWWSTAAARGFAAPRAAEFWWAAPTLSRRPPPRPTLPSSLAAG